MVLLKLGLEFGGEATEIALGFAQYGLNSF